MKIRKKNIDNLLLGLLIISLYFSRVNIDIGFTIKPYMVITAIILIYTLNDFYVKKLFKFEVYMITFIFLFSLTSLRFLYPEKHIRYILAFILIMLFYFVNRTFLSRFTIKNIEESLVYYSNIAIATSLIYYFLGIISLRGSFVGNGLHRYGVLLDRGIPRLTGLISSDPNIFVFVVTIIFIYTFSNINCSRNRIGLFLSGLSIILTFSRGAYIAIGLAIIIMIIMQNNLIKSIKIILVILIAVISINFIAKYFSINLIDIITSRFDSIAIDGGSGRDILWRNAIESFKTHPIFGIGINATTSYGSKYYSNSHYVHNSILEVLSEGGVVVFSIFMIFIMSLLIYSIKIYFNNKKNIFIFISFLAMIIQMMFLSVIYNEMFYFFILLVYRYSDNYKKNNSNFKEIL